MTEPCGLFEWQDALPENGRVSVVVQIALKTFCKAKERIGHT
jgi:hypothetical protein